MSRIVVLVHSACAPARACSGPRRGMSRLDFRGRAACSMAVERHSEQRASGATGRRLVACPRNSQESFIVFPEFPRTEGRRRLC